MFSRTRALVPSLARCSRAKRSFALLSPITRLTRLTRLTLALLSLVLPGRATGAQDVSSIAGRWRGTSTCVKKAWNAACHDEIVVYDVAPSSTQPRGALLHACKIVNGAPEWMGDLELSWSEERHEWIGDFANSRVSIRWHYRIAGDAMTGGVTMRDTGREGRTVALQRDKAPSAGRASLPACTGTSL